MIQTDKLARISIALGVIGLIGLSGPLMQIKGSGWATMILGALAIITGTVAIAKNENMGISIAGLVLGLIDIILFWIIVFMLSM